MLFIGCQRSRPQVSVISFFLSFFLFLFLFTLQLHVRKKKIITEIRWFRYSCERIESEYFTNTMTSQHINSSGIRKFHCHLAFVRIALKRQQKRSSIFSFTRDLSYIASLLFTNVNFTHVRT